MKLEWPVILNRCVPLTGEYRINIERTKIHLAAFKMLYVIIPLLFYTSKVFQPVKKSDRINLIMNKSEIHGDLLARGHDLQTKRV